MPSVNTHETLVRDAPIQTSSDRSFGFVMAVFFAVLAILPVLRRGVVRPWFLAVAIAWVSLALLKPALLHPLNVLWSQIGLLLGRIVNPIVMAILFYGVITPAAIILRALGKDPLKLRYDNNALSYWLPRNPPGPPPETMSNQF